MRRGSTGNRRRKQSCRVLWGFSVSSPSFPLLLICIMPALACLPSWRFCAGGLRQTGRWVSRLKINWHLRGIYSGGKRERIEAQLRVSRLERNCWNKQLLRLHSLIISVSIYMKWVNVEGGNACGSAWHRRSFFALCFASMSDNLSPRRLADCRRRQQGPLGIRPYASLRNDSLFVVIHAGFTKVDWPFGSDQTWSFLAWLSAGEGKLRLVGWSLFAWAPLSLPEDVVCWCCLVSPKQHWAFSLEWPCSCLLLLYHHLLITSPDSLHTWPCGCLSLSFS